MMALYWMPLVLPWVAGATAGASMIQSLTYSTYEGAVDANLRLDNLGYTKWELNIKEGQQEAKQQQQDLLDPQDLAANLFEGRG